MELHHMPLVRLLPVVVLQFGLLPLVFGSTMTASSSNSTDLLALLSFKDSISNDPFIWNQTLHYCQWQGITCGYHDRVTSLDLNSLNLAGFISPSIANLSFLQLLHLGNNQLQGHIPPELGYLAHLKYLNLSHNSLKGEIPANVANCSAIRLISLSSNLLDGEIPAEFGLLSNLLQLTLDNNNLTGGIPPSIGNLSSLTVLTLPYNNLEGSIPPSLGAISGLQILELAQNRLSGKPPSPIYNISSLHGLDLGGNQLSGTLPLDIGRTLPNLQELVMYDNKFEGPIPMSLSNASGLVRIILSNNSFSGPVPSNLGALHNLSWVVLSRNLLEAGDHGGEWNFLTSLTNCSNLEYLELYNNKIRGVLPKSIANLSTQVSWLTIGGNQISGRIPEEIGNLVGLNALFLEENLLTGAIPATIGKLQRLQTLWLFMNKLSGEIPATLGNLTQLTELYFEVNELQGAIPHSLGNLQSLTALNFSYNNLTGEVPREVASISSLSAYLDLSYNSLTGVLPSEVGSLINLQEFNVSNNQLSGEIPGTLGQCQVLQYLYMGNNFFHGPIPLSLGDIRGLGELDLSHNNLSGQIPGFLQNSRSLQYLNLSFNNLDGEVPTTGVFAHMKESSVLGNEKLCGGSPDLRLHACSVKENSGEKASALQIILPVVGGAFFLCFFTCLFFIFYRKRWFRRKNSTVDLADGNRYMSVSYAELHKATDGFSSSGLIGAGSFSSVYKGILEENGEVVAVKVLRLQKPGALKSFMAECEALRNIRHRNLVKVITSCSGVDFEGCDFKAIVYEFMPCGTLKEWLHPAKFGERGLRNLSLVQRLNIAIDVGCALEYLHYHGQNPIVHCDLKPSNVLLDEDMTAHIGDFGLARFLPTDISSSSQVSAVSQGLKGSIGYIAPEYGMGSQVSTQGDVYSYGILLLEMLTGLSPTTDVFKDGLNLRSYAQMSFPGRVMEIIDLRILEEEESIKAYDSEEVSLVKARKRERLQDLLISAVGIALRCSEEEPRGRVEMKDVTKEIHIIRELYFRMHIQEEKKIKVIYTM